MDAQIIIIVWIGLGLIGTLIDIIKKGKALQILKALVVMILSPLFMLFSFGTWVNASTTILQHLITPVIVGILLGPIGLIRAIFF